MIIFFRQLILSIVPLMSPLAAQLESGEALGFGYTRKDGFVYFSGQRIDQAGRDNLARFSRFIGRDLELCQEVHAPTFVALSEQYTKDRNTVYYKWISPGEFWVVQLPEADGATFEVLGFNLARDARYVWWYGEVLPEIDARTVEVVREGFVWKDAHGVWYQHERIDGADPQSFKHLARGFYRDRHRVYWGRTPLETADPLTFRTFGDDSAYGADSRTVWKAAEPLVGPDPQTFEPIHRGVYKDRNGVFECPGQPLADADVRSFRKVRDLDLAGTALLRDGQSDYLYLPYRGEVFRLAVGAQSLRVTRSIWSGRPTPRRIAVSTAVLSKQGWSELDLELLSATERSISKRKLMAQERHLLDIHRAVFTRAWEQLRNSSRSEEKR